MLANIWKMATTFRIYQLMVDSYFWSSEKCLEHCMWTKEIQGSNRVFQMSITIMRTVKSIFVWHFQYYVAQAKLQKCRQSSKIC